MAETPDEPVVYVLEMPAGIPLANANDRGHWRRRHRLTKNLRKQAARLFRASGIPGMKRAAVIGYLEPPNRQPRDPANWYPSFKAIIDGMVDAGFLPDDNSKHLDGPDMRLGPVYPKGRLVLHITDLSHTLNAPQP
ncbi:hypothetical protein [Nonomuraea sp. NPDC003214]